MATCSFFIKESFISCIVVVHACSVVSDSFPPACQAPLHEIFRARIRGRLPFPTPRDPPDPVSLALAGRFFYHSLT